MVASGNTAPGEIRIGNTSFPFRMSMGAMVRFRRLTGHEMTDMQEDNTEDLSALVYCCIQSACAVDKVPFTMTFLDFCDMLGTEEMQTMADNVNALVNSAPADKGDGEKKSPSLR